MIGTIAEGEVSSHNLLRGTVEDIMFLGAVVRIRMALAENKLFFDTFNNPHLEMPRLGQSVTVRFPREAVLMLETA
jgi:putative spermidine/putrescine transport system ATP-binding protein